MIALRGPWKEDKDQDHCGDTRAHAPAVADVRVLGRRQVRGNAILGRGQRAAAYGRRWQL